MTGLDVLARWLADNAHHLATHPAAGEAYDDITSAIANARRVIDRPADKVFIGRCDGHGSLNNPEPTDGPCGDELYAQRGAAAARCYGCTHRYDVRARHEWLLEQVKDVLGTTTEIVRTLDAIGGIRTTVDVINGYVHRKRLHPRGRGRLNVNNTRIPTYRVGDVVDLIIETASRSSGGGRATTTV